MLVAIIIVWCDKAQMISNDVVVQSKRKIKFSHFLRFVVIIPILRSAYFNS